jgi:ubiquinone/menaquinone biosynthesis C-methylase UbiE
MPQISLWKDLFLRFLGNPSYVRKIQKPILFRMLDLKRDETVLDAGCGEGYFSREVAPKCRLCVGIDFAVNKCYFPLSSRNGVTVYASADVQKLPFTAETFDKILLSSVLQVAKNDKEVLKECHRVLKLDGVLVLSVTTEYQYVKKLNSLKPLIKHKLGVLGKGYYSFDEVTRLLKMENFQVLETEHSPKKLGSLLYELELSLWVRFRTSILGYALFPVFYFLSYFDEIMNGKTGNELLVKARKVQPKVS